MGRKVGGSRSPQRSGGQGSNRHHALARFNDLHQCCSTHSPKNKESPVKNKGRGRESKAVPASSSKQRAGTKTLPLPLPYVANPGLSGSLGSHRGQTNPAKQTLRHREALKTVKQELCSNRPRQSSGRQFSEISYRHATNALINKHSRGPSPRTLQQVVCPWQKTPVSYTPAYVPLTTRDCIATG